MPQQAPLADENITRLLDQLPEQSSLFRGIDRQALGDLLRQAAHRVHLARGENLITEGDDAEALYFIESGRFEVRKLSDQETGAAGNPGEGGHRIGLALPGTVVGEVALLDRGKRSATVRALEASVALVLRMVDMERSVQGAPHPALQMRLNLAHEMAQKMRHSTSSAVHHLEQSLLEAQKRVEMARFMSRVLIGTCLYIYALVLMEPLKAVVPDTTVLSVLVLLGFATGLWLNIRTSMFPASAYGFNLERWRAALAEAALFSLPFLVLIVALKWALLAHSPALAGHALFDFYRHKGLGLAGTLAVVATYALFVPIQEMVARSGIQSSMMMFLRPRHRVPMSIFMSTLLFSATHLHTGFLFAAAVFPMGLFWGWLYSRHPTLVGVVFSHLLIGIWAVFVVSFPFF